MNRRQRRKAWLAKQILQEPQFGAGVGLILGIQHHNIPRLPAMQAWQRAVPKQYRKPSKAKITI